MQTILPPPLADYLAGHHVMTLATQGPAGPWAAAVFYASDGGSLIFLSSPKSRHCRDLALDPRCAATIQEDYRDWQQIKGIQLEGRVSELQGEDERRARQIYGAKFPIAGPLAHVAPAIVEALARVRWFRLVPERFYFIDNSRGFGHRDEIELGAGCHAEKGLRGLIASGAISWGGTKPTLRAPVKITARGTPVSQMVLEDRR